jgi:hypothetical protein
MADVDKEIQRLHDKYKDAPASWSEHGGREWSTQNLLNEKMYED